VEHTEGEQTSEVAIIVNSVGRKASKTKNETKHIHFTADSDYSITMSLSQDTVIKHHRKLCVAM